MDRERIGGRGMLRITTLIENSAGDHQALHHEHGLSFFVELDGHGIVFDTGQSGAFIENAANLKIDLSAPDYVVLSHGHYDHSGGLTRLADVSGTFGLIVGQGFFREKYGFRNGVCQFLGNNFDESFLKEKRIRYSFAPEGLTEILPGVFVVSGFPRVHDDERINPRFVLRTPNGFEPDAFDDEILLAVATPRGLIVLLGCSHPGLKNMLDAVRERIGLPIHAVLGGTHLVESDEASIGETIRYLGESGIERIGVSHCTGDPAMSRLKAANTGFFHNVTGSSLFIE